MVFHLNLNRFITSIRFFFLFNLIVQSVEGKVLVEKWSYFLLFTRGQQKRKNVLEYELYKELKGYSSVVSVTVPMSRWFVRSVRN